MKYLRITRSRQFSILAFLAAVVLSTQAMQTEQALQIKHSQSEYMELVRRQLEDSAPISSTPPEPTSISATSPQENSASTSPQTSTESRQEFPQSTNEDVSTYGKSQIVSVSPSSPPIPSSLSSASLSPTPTDRFSVSSTSTTPAIFPTPFRPLFRTDDDIQISSISVIFFSALTIGAVLCFALWYHRQRQQRALPKWTVTYDTSSFFIDQHSLEKGEYPEYDEDGPTDRCKFGAIKPGKSSWEKPVSTPGRVTFTTQNI